MLIFLKRLAILSLIILSVVAVFLQQTFALEYLDYYKQDSSSYYISWKECAKSYYITKATSINGEYKHYKTTKKTHITVPRESNDVFYKVQPMVGGFMQPNNVVIKVEAKIERKKDYKKYAAEKIVNGKNVLFDGYDINKKDLQKIWRYIAINYPTSAINARKTFNCYLFNNSNNVYELKIKDRSYLKKAKATEKILKGIKVDGSPEEKARMLHNYILERTSYDYDDKEPYNGYAYGVAIKGKAVCQGYAMAYKYLCENNGLKCNMIVQKIGKDKELHAWNVVKINDKWYNVDCTWDDSNGSKYQYFLVSDKNCHGETKYKCDTDYFSFLDKFMLWTA